MFMAGMWLNDNANFVVFLPSCLSKKLLKLVARVALSHIHIAVLQWTFLRLTTPVVSIPFECIAPIEVTAWGAFPPEVQGVTVMG